MKRLYLFLIIAALAFGQDFELLSLMDSDSLIEVQVNPCNGLFAVGMGDGTPITYGFGEGWLSDSFPAVETGYITFKINDVTYGNLAEDAHGRSLCDTTLNDVADSVITNIDSTSNEIVTEWFITGSSGGFVFSQILSPTLYRGNPAIKTEYRCINGSSYPANCGAFLHVRMDGVVPPFLTYNNELFTDYDEKPYAVSHMITGDDFPPDYMRCYIWLDDLPFSTPDWLMAGEYTSSDYDSTTGIVSKGWDIYPYDVEGWRYDNMGFGLRWDGGLTSPGEYSEYTTYIGYDTDTYSLSCLYIDDFADGGGFDFSGCVLDTVDDIRLTIASGLGRDYDLFIVEVDYPSYITPIGPSVDTVSEYGITDLLFSVPSSMFEDVPFDIEIPVHVSAIDGGCDSTIVLEYHIPEIDLTPDDLIAEVVDNILYVSLPDTADTLIRDNIDFDLYIDDTLAQIALMPYTIEDDRIVLPIQGEYRNWSGFLPIFDETELCVNITNEWDCVSSICTTLFFNDYNLEEVEGWNLLSTPIQEHVYVGDFFGEYVPPAFGYSPDSGYYAIDILRPGQAFWLLGTAADTIDYSGYTLADSVHWHLYPGWNLVGGPHRVVHLSDGFFDDIIHVDEVYTLYDEARGYWLVNSLSPGRGYFVFAYEEWEGWVR